MFLFSYSHDACIGELERAFAANHPMTTAKTPPARPSIGASLTPRGRPPLPTRPPLITPHWATGPTTPVVPMGPPMVPMGPRIGQRVAPRFPAGRPITVIPPPARAMRPPVPCTPPTGRRVHPPSMHVPRVVQPPAMSMGSPIPDTPRTVAMGQGLLAYVAVYIYIYIYTYIHTLDSCLL